jgi:VanZ family protein
MIKLIIWCKPFARYLFIVWLLTIITVSSIPSIPTLKIQTGETEIRLDYLMHFCEYGLLAFLAFLTFSGSEFKISFKKYMMQTIGLIFFAVLDEFHQKFIPGRSYNIDDILSNITGILAGLVFCVVVFRGIANRVM